MDIDMDLDLGPVPDTEPIVTVSAYNVTSIVKSFRDPDLTIARMPRMPPLGPPLPRTAQSILRLRSNNPKKFTFEESTN